MNSSSPNNGGWADAKGLWALFWRMLLLGPVVAVFGSLALVIVIALDGISPILAVVLIVDGNYLWAVVTAVAWLIWLRFARPVRRLVFEGFEHGSL